MSASFALLLAALAWGADAPPLADIAPPRSAPGWTRQGQSLLLYGPDGDLKQELPLRKLEESATVSMDTLGGTSPDGVLAWTLDRRVTWDRGRRRVLESRRVFRVYGKEGRELWKDDAPDTPERGEPVVFSDDGQTLLLARRLDEGWLVEARSWMGGPQASAGPFPRLISMALTANGRYFLARWAVPDTSDTHSFVEIASKRRRDVPSSELTLGLARIDDDGVVRSGSRVIFAFEPPPGPAK